MMAVPRCTLAGINIFPLATTFPMNGVISTNFGSYHAKISTVNGDMLSVELVDQPSDVQLDLASATNEKDWKHEHGSGSWSQHRFWRSMNTWRLPTGELRMESATEIHATLAIHPIHWAEFTIQPRYEK